MKTAAQWKSALRNQTANSIQNIFSNCALVMIIFFSPVGSSQALAMIDGLG